MRPLEGTRVKPAVRRNSHKGVGRRGREDSHIERLFHELQSTLKQDMEKAYKFQSFLPARGMVLNLVPHWSFIGSHLKTGRTGGVKGSFIRRSQIRIKNCCRGFTGALKN